MNDGNDGDPEDGWSPCLSSMSSDECCDDEEEECDDSDDDEPMAAAADPTDNRSRKRKLGH